jgi:hypothetical protein
LDGRLPAVADAVASLAASARAGDLDAGAALEALTAVRALSAGMERCELALMDALRDAGVPWSQVAAAMGAARRQTAQKRHADLAARHPAPATGGDAPPAAPPAAPPPALPGDVDAGEAPPPRTDEEWSASMRHRPVPGLGKEWTYALPSESSGDAILWWNKTTRAGGARQAWPRKGWEPTGKFSYMASGPSQPSRLKALQYAAGTFEARRRKETIAGPDAPLPGLPGWWLRQTLAQKDQRTWQVIAPDGAVAGTVYPGWSGSRRHWAAETGDPAREYHHGIAVTPWEPGLQAGPDGEEWKTRDAAAYGVAAEHDETVPAPSEALALAQRLKEERAAGKPA